ncbi:MAG: double zinc ribbon domain-containing protein [Armatimonadota bacterium]
MHSSGAQENPTTPLNAWSGTNRMHPLLRGFLDLLYPPRCEACGELRREPICTDCLSAIERVTPPMCDLCGEPFDPLAQAAPRCADCRGRRRSFSVARSAAYYAAPLTEAIRRFKYDCQMVLWRPLGRLMVEALNNGASAIDPDTVDVICAVPLHPSRLRERGFNQSELLAQVISEELGKPTGPLLERTRPTLPQVSLPAQSRPANVHDAFSPRLQETIADQRVLLVDDLFTTGSTLTECARVLRRAGAADVRVFTLARPLPRWRQVRPDVQ